MKGRLLSAFCVLDAQRLASRTVHGVINPASLLEDTNGNPILFIVFEVLFNGREVILKPAEGDGRWCAACVDDQRNNRRHRRICSLLSG